MQQIHLLEAILLLNYSIVYRTGRIYTDQDAGHALISSTLTEYQLDKNDEFNALLFANAMRFGSTTLANARFGNSTDDRLIIGQPLTTAVLRPPGTPTLQPSSTEPTSLPSSLPTVVRKYVAQKIIHTITIILYLGI